MQESKQRTFWPRGIVIYENVTPRLLSGKWTCSIRSKGRTGARARSKLMRLSPEQREPILAEWAEGRAVML